MAPNNPVLAIHISTQSTRDGNSLDFRGLSEARNISYIVLDDNILMEASGHFITLIKITDLCNHAANCIYVREMCSFNCINSEKLSNMCQTL